MSKVKIVLSLALVFLWIISCSAMAEIRIINAQQGEEFELPVRISSNPDRAVFAILRLEYDHNIFELIPGFVQKDSVSILNLNGISEGEAGKAQLHVNENAENGTYPISIIIESAYDLDENPVTRLKVDTISVRVGKKRKENEYYPNGKLKVQYEYNNSGYLYKTTYYNRFGYITKTLESTQWDESGNILKQVERHSNSFAKYAGYFYTFTYDSQGNKTSSYYTYADGSPGKRLTYQYDDKNRLQGSTTFDVNNNVISHNTNYQYDGEDHLISYFVMNSDNSIKESYQQVWNNGILAKITKKDSSNKTILQTIYDSYGDVIESSYNDDTSTYTYYDDHYEIYRFDSQYGYSLDIYNDKGQCVRSSDMDKHGNISYEVTYEYDSSGKMIKSIFNHPRSPSSDFSVTSEYDNRDLVIRDIYLGPTGELNLYILYEYDSQQRTIKEENYNEKGIKYYETLYRYLDDGKMQRKILEYDYSDGTLKSDSNWETI